MAGIRGVVVSASEFSEAKRLFKTRGKVSALVEKLFSEIEEITKRKLPNLGVCLHDQFSGQLCAPLPHLPAWTDETVIHVLANVDWWKERHLELLKGEHLARVQGASSVFEEYCRGYDLEFMVYMLCGHEACHHLEMFQKDEKYYTVAPRWIEEGLCFYIPYELIKKRKRGMSELALEVDRIVFEALSQPFSERDHWLDEFYDHEAKYLKAGSKYRGLIDLWDYSAAVLAVDVLSASSEKGLREIIDTISSSYEQITESLDRAKANREFLRILFEELRIKEITVKDFCSEYRICPTQ